MDCKETLENLSLLLDGELAPEKEQKLMGHLEECWHCKDVRENEEKLKELIREKLAYSKKVPVQMGEKIRSLISAEE